MDRRRAAWMGITGEKGVTLVELLVVVSIIVILSMVLSFSYIGWKGRYQVEGEVRHMYADLANARALAMSHRRMHFIDFPTSDIQFYSVYEDTDPSPDGDGLLDTTKDTVVAGMGGRNSYDIVTTRQDYGISANGLFTQGVAAGGTDVLVSPNSILFVNSPDIDPDYNCIELTATRINIGLWNGAACETK